MIKNTANGVKKIILIQSLNKIIFLHIGRYLSSKRILIPELVDIYTRKQQKY